MFINEIRYGPLVTERCSGSGEDPEFVGTRTGLAYCRSCRASFPLRKDGKVRVHSIKYRRVTFR